jgi:signal transduction histidine kinase
VKLRSLRARFITGTLLWAGALFIGAAALGTAIALHRPRWALLVHDSLFALLGAVLVTAGASVILRGLSPFRTLRARLADVREGRTARLEGEYPSEVAPLVSDLNGLLDEREERVARAVARAGDLAHGLKTPLAILAQDVERAEASGQHDLASSIQRQVERMRRQVDSHLAQARASAAGRAPTARAPLAECARGLVRTLERLHTGRGITFDISGISDRSVRVPMEDLEEMLGNLLENACKWTASRVVVADAAEPGRVAITVDDDGRGLAPSMRQQVLQRGVRVDEAAPGSGLGLAIVRDLAEAYGGSITLEESPFGGLRARLLLPS